ncbi:hypothetical protein GCM10009838_15790 [Catenulispora subtropica]|uniref:Uncharacterized protein n=1 Tax=Catenulispora subtropica TaxID=450798 RepID=A0ABN2QY56_9ACTN
MITVFTKVSHRYSWPLAPGGVDALFEIPVDLKSGRRGHAKRLRKPIQSYSQPRSFAMRAARWRDLPPVFCIAEDR